MHSALDLVDMVGLVRDAPQLHHFSFCFKIFFILNIGHNEQKDEWMPRLIKYLNIRVTGGAARVFCGSAFSLVISSNNLPYIFGNNNKSQVSMYPKVVDQLCGTFISYNQNSIYYILMLISCRFQLRKRWLFHDFTCFIS